jgi:hypothetical protein
VVAEYPEKTGEECDAVGMIFEHQEIDVVQECEKNVVKLKSTVPLKTQRCVLTKTPLDPLKEHQSFELTLTDLPQGSIVAFGLAAKPYPLFRAPTIRRSAQRRWMQVL